MGFEPFGCYASNSILENSLPSSAGIRFHIFDTAGHNLELNLVLTAAVVK